MLEHVVEAQVLDSVVRGVDMLVRISELRLDHECRRVAGLGG